VEAGEDPVRDRPLAKDPFFHRPVSEIMDAMPGVRGE
jgi:hypothetical protein